MADFTLIKRPPKKTIKIEPRLQVVVAPAPPRPNTIDAGARKQPTLLATTARPAPTPAVKAQPRELKRADVPPTSPAPALTQPAFETVATSMDIVIQTPNLPPPIPKEIPLRYLPEVGTRAWLRIYWGEDCPSQFGSGGVGCHNAQHHILDSDKLEAWDLGGDMAAYPAEMWPTVCDHCGAAVPTGELSQVAKGASYGNRHILRKRLYETPEGTPIIEGEMQPGDCFYATWLHDNDRCFYWTDCTTPHLTVILPPDHHPWDTSGRANNCTKPNDDRHRCWVVHGDPSKGEIVTVDKNGVTCEAGAGSIATPHYHAMLQGSVLRQC